MLRIFCFSTLFSFALFLSGCGVRAVPLNFQFPKKSQYGLAAFSLQCGNGWSSPFSLYYARKKSIDFFNFDSFDFNCVDNYPVYYMLKLKGGRYSFNQLTVDNYYSYFNINFSVIPGKATYIGSIHINILPRKKFRLSIYNDANRDMPLFLAKYKNISRGQYRIKIARFPKRK